MRTGGIDRIRLCVTFLVVPLAGAADSFLQKQDQAGVGLVADLEALLGPGSLQHRALLLEDQLLTMFRALPKTSEQLLAHGTARYALHRVLADLHGWSISGLAANATTFNTTSLVGSGILRGLLPPHLEHLFGKHIGAEGFHLRDLAILTSTIEHLVHEDQKSILRKSCEFLDLPTVGPMSENDMETIIALYMVTFMQNWDASGSSVKQAHVRLKRGFTSYPGWNDAAMLLRDERESLAFNDIAIGNPFIQRESSMQVAERTVEQVSGHLARKHHEPDCQEIRESLLEYEHGNTGRIRLSDFYRASLDSRYFFVETQDYLRAVGALDESDSVAGPKVIIPNYVLEKSNCLSRASTYSICCMNECEELLGKLERHIASPEASPKEVHLYVAGLSSSTVHGPRNISQLLVRRLDEVAAANGGKLLLHGRLFAQWMHQAFPRECPYPHLVGTTTSLSPSEWEQEKGQSFRIDSNWTREEEHNQTLSFIDALGMPTGTLHQTSEEDSDLMWTYEEELLAQPTSSSTTRLLELVCARHVYLRLLVPAFLFAILAAMKKASAKKHGAKDQKCFV